MRKGPLPPVYLFAVIACMAALHVGAPLGQIIVLPWRLFGLVPLALGIALNLLADRDFKRHATTVKPFETSSTLMTRGVFRLSRNPMYLGMTLLLAGLALLAGSVSPWLPVVPFPILMEVLFIRPEEKMLQATFGDAYLAYRRQTRPWI